MTLLSLCTHYIFNYCMTYCSLYLVENTTQKLWTENESAEELILIFNPICSSLTQFNFLKCLHYIFDGACQMIWLNMFSEIS